MPKGQAKPAIIKDAEGNRSKLAKAKIKRDPRGRGRPRLPMHLNAVERQLYADIVASLPDNLLSLADEATLERMAVAWAEFRAIQAVIRRGPFDYVLENDKGGSYRNPLLIAREKATHEMHLAGEVLGLSPVSRARLSAKETAADDPMELLLGMDGDPNGAWSTAPGAQQ